MYQICTDIKFKISELNQCDQSCDVETSSPKYYLPIKALKKMKYSVMLCRISTIKLILVENALIWPVTCICYSSISNTIPSACTTRLSMLHAHSIRRVKASSFGLHSATFNFIYVVESSCTINPCLNGGSCSESISSADFTCDCLTGYSGERCQIGMHYPFWDMGVLVDQGGWLSGAN